MPLSNQTTAFVVRGSSVETSVITGVWQGIRGASIRHADRKSGGPRYGLNILNIDVPERDFEHG